MNKIQKIVIFLLWHNNYFTDYKYGSFIKEYKKIVEFIYESKIGCVTPDVLVKIITYLGDIRC